MTNFEEIYTRYFSEVFKYVLGLCQNESLAEEITQETFFKAMRHIDQFHGKCKLYVWLCQIAKNTYFSVLRKQKRMTHEFNDNLLDMSLDIEKKFCEGETAERLHILIHELDEPYKEVFTLRVFGELQFNQIGSLFGKTAEWARVIFYRAKKKIQEAMK